jgi:hypothetical protein
VMMGGADITTKIIGASPTATPIRSHSPNYSRTLPKAIERACHELCPGCPEARCMRTFVNSSLTLPPILMR